MSLGLRVRLSLMMFLQYFVWGIWLPMLGQHLTKSGFTLSKDQIAWIFTVYGFGSIIGPFLLGQIADRYFAAERVLAAAHLLGGLLLIAAAYVTSFWAIFGTLFVYCNLYMPTMGLSNSITFRSLGEARQSYFPGIRLWGTIGWICAGLFFSAYLEYRTLGFYRSLFEVVGLEAAFIHFLAWWTAHIVPLLEPLFQIPWIGEPKFRDCLRISGAVSILYCLYGLTLPHTPPVPAQQTDPIDKRSAVRESLELMRFPSFAVLVVITGLIGIMLAFYFACETYFLEAIGIPASQTGAYMTIGQIAEFVVMMFVPMAVAKLGIKNTMLLGAGAWALRFGLSSYGQPRWLMISTIALHGFAFGFFFVVAQMYVDRAASRDIKATAQNLLIFVVYGMGTILGSVLTGRVRNYFTTTINGRDVESWRGIWMGPFLLTVLCVIAFALLFREEEIRKPALQPGEALA
jgi:MFS family permease